MTLGKLNALLGLIAAASVSYYIITRLHTASAPIPTVIKASNASREPVRMSDFLVAGQPLTGAEASLPAAGAGANAAAAALVEWESPAIALAPGRAFALQARVQGSRSFVASCELDPRPPGNCFIRASHHGRTDLTCAYVCEGEGGEASRE